MGRGQLCARDWPSRDHWYPWDHCSSWWNRFNVSPSCSLFTAHIEPFTSWTFLPKYSPRNLPGSILNLVACAMGLLLLAVVLTYIKWENKQRDMGRRDWRLVDAEQKGIRSEDLGHQSPE